MSLIWLKPKTGVRESLHVRWMQYPSDCTKCTTSLVGIAVTRIRGPGTGDGHRRAAEYKLKSLFVFREKKSFENTFEATHLLTNEGLLEYILMFASSYAPMERCWGLSGSHEYGLYGSHESAHAAKSRPYRKTRSDGRDLDGPMYVNISTSSLISQNFLSLSF